jgi:glycosyltransferase involved in cell wall biosynthesis
MHSKQTLPKASVIIPAYNASNTIQHCLRALEKQTAKPNEILVVNDGSTDNTAEIVGKFKKAKIINLKKNTGPAKARNFGAKEAKNEIIIFLDSDCIPVSNWLEEMLIPFTDKQVVGVQGAYKTRQRSLVAQFEQLDIEYRYEKMKKSKKLDWIGSYSAAYDRKTFLKEKGFDETFTKASGEDADFSYHLSEKGKKLFFNPKAIVYHTHPETMAHYLKVKFYRAYWRVRMYLKHPKKAVKDSYTPKGVKYNVAFAIATVVFLLLSKFHSHFVFWAVISFAIYIVSFLSYFPKIRERDVGFILFAFFLIFLRSIVFGLGLMLGFLDGKVRE